MRRIMPLIAIMVCLGGCIHNFRPGPGMSADYLEAEKAQCRLFARGMTPGFAVAAAGRNPGQVYGMMGAGMAVGTIAVLADQADNYNNCMLARGWLIDRGPKIVESDGSGPDRRAASVSSSDPAGVRSAAALGGRRDMLVSAKDIEFRPVVAEMIGQPRAAQVIEAFHGGVGAQVGLRKGDYILDFNGMRINGVYDIDRELRRLQASDTTSATIWRDGRHLRLSMRF
jgi:S1-C subfamily serine protease